MRVRTATPLLLLGAAPLLLGTAAPASASTVVASWSMNEPAGARVMRDSSGNHLDGAIGTEIRTHAAVAGRVGYGFAHLPNGSGPAHPGHLVTVPSDPRLNPGSADYSVTVTARFGPSGNFRNLVQKGQAGFPGGFYKLEVDRGGVVCLFRGATGQGGVSSGVINDGKWHTVTCTRTAGAVTMVRDGKVTASKAVATGDITNNAPVAIGGKPGCNQTTVECDYFAGTVDAVSISSG